MKNIILPILISLNLLVSGCAVNTISKAEAFPQMYIEKPASVLVVPSINHSTAADAPILYSSTINEPLSNAGFYVLPIEVTNRFLLNEGLSEGEMLIDIPPQKFADAFGADAVLYVAIEKWDTNYYILGGNVTVAVEFTMKSTKTGEKLWGYKNQLVLDTSGNDNGGGLLAKLITAALTTALQDYVPIARNVNLIALQAIPFGKYHKMHNKDQSMKLPPSKVKK
ncbi:MAG: DUF799 family lipoprotein [Gammaproteobacteria bacterium]|jgi:hypothetical protein|nr:DUF799 family lipoprotein [Gammaproteobacteria bacterium]MBT6835949.1 DUF799 family lipoprotein [Bacteroidota bacterium]